MSNTDAKFVVMQCGHVGIARIYQQGSTEIKPCCLFCIGHTDKAEQIDEHPPDLTGRTARCSTCGHKIDSAWDLPFFSYNPQGTMDFYYCGCRGWD